MMRTVATLLLAASAVARADVPSAPPETQERLAAVVVPFVENAGQSDPRVAYYAHTFSGTVFVTHRGDVVYALPARSGEGEAAVAQRAMVRERFVGGRSAAPVPGRAAGTHVSIFHGSDPSRWQPRMASYADVSLGAVWPGIRVTLEAHGKQVEKVFTVEPGAALDVIRVRVAGARRLAMAADGGLTMRTAVGEVRLTRPIAYQWVAGGRRMVDAAYALAGEKAYGFSVGEHDPTAPVVIDPLLQATYLGGSGYVFGEATDAIAFAATGDVYVAGVTASTTFPGTTGGAQSVAGGNGALQPGDAFVARLNPALTMIEQATYLGGSDGDGVSGLAIAPATGEVYVGGTTFSSDFPGTSGGPQSAYAGGQGDGFVARLDASLTALHQATYLGGTANERLVGLAIAPSGEVYVAGTTGSANFPHTTGGAQETYAGGDSGGAYGGDAFVARLNANLTAIDQATYVGGLHEEGTTGIAIAATTGEVYVTGQTASPFPGTTGGAQSTFSGVRNGFIARLNANLTAIDQATYLGGSGQDATTAIAIAATGKVYVTGQTSITSGTNDFPGTTGGAQPTSGGGGDAFVARLDANLTTLEQATYLGASKNDVASAIALAPTTGEVYVGGLTSSPDFPGVAGGVQTTVAGFSPHGFIARLDPTLTVLDQATFLGGAGDDRIMSLAVSPTTGDVYTGGVTTSADFPGTTGGPQATLVGSRAAFVARLSADLQATGSPGSTSTTTTTTLPCTTARCLLDAAATSVACAGQTIPAPVAAKIAKAENLIDQAASSTGKKQKKLLKGAKKALKQARTKATKASKGKRPKLTSGCAMSLADALNGVAGSL